MDDAAPEPQLDAPEPPKLPFNAPRVLAVGYTTPKARVMALLAAVADAHGMSVKTLLSHSRDQRTVAARRDAVAAIATAFPYMSYPQIGRILNRDHTTIMHHAAKLGLPKRGKGRIPPPAPPDEMP